MKVFITGGAGFVGTNTALYFKSKGWDVVTYDNLTTFELDKTGYNVRLSRQYNLNLLKEHGIKFIKGGVDEKYKMVNLTNDCDYIIHCAAQPAMTLSIDHPDIDIETNVMGTFNVLSTAMIHDIPMVNCSSIHVYGNDINYDLSETNTRFERTPSMIDETQPVLKGNVTPLHASKLSAEHYVNAFIDTYNLKAANFRLTGMYGPLQFGGMDHGWVANFAIRTVMERPITIFGTDKQVRDILYVDDVAKAFEAFYNHQIPGTYNIGGGMNTSISIKECLDMLKDITGNEQDIHYEPHRLGDLHYFVCDSSKAKRLLNWEAEVMPIDGIKTLVEWVEDNKELF